MGAGGECEALVDARDWSGTALGPRSSWPPSLRATVANVLRSRQPMLLFWGPELIQIYNDAFVPSFGGSKHPAAMGQPAAECWADAWPVVGAQIAAVMRDGEPAWHTDALVPIERNGRMEEVFWSYSYSPAHDDAGAIAGTLVICTELTGRVVSARRLGALASLASATAAVDRREDLLATLRTVVETHPADVPFAVVRELRDGEPEPVVRVALGVDPGLVRAALALAPAAPSGSEIALGIPVPSRVWPEPVERAFVSELTVRRAASRLRIVLGISPRRPFDAAYRSFFEQLVELLAGALRRIDEASAARSIEEQRDDLLLQAPVATALLVGRGHTYRLANARYREMVGRDPTGKRFVEAFPELVGSETEAMLDRVYATGRGHTARAQRVTIERAGAAEERFFDVAIEPLRAPDGAVYGMMVVAAEVTDEVRANRAKDDFLAMLGHELRNPLAPIASAIELMKRKDIASSAERDTIERQLRHVTRLVDDLLDVSRITRGALRLEREAVAIGRCVESAVEMVRPGVRERGQALTVELAPGLYVDGDPARLAQVVANLLTNAVRYTPPTGTIRVSAEGDARSVRIRVRDDGNGIDPELLPRVFEPFVQGKRGADRAEGGLGIGLAITKSLVELHGGSIAAHSEGRGMGTEVVVTLPRAAAPEPAASLARAGGADAGASSKRRILVVDDNEDAAQLLGELLRSCGHDAFVVHTPDDALARVAVDPPEVAVLDIGLPGMDGYELAGRIRATSSCRLIALTGYGQPSDRARATDAGFDAHLVKPVDLRTLLSTLG